MKKSLLQILIAAMMVLAMIPAAEVSVFAEDTSEAFAKFDTGTATLTFFRDAPGKYSNGETETYTDAGEAEQTITYYTGIETDEYIDDTSVPWYGIRESVNTVVFADRISPKSTANWFRRTTSLENIEGIEKLDTSKVINMAHMFHNCSVRTLDVSGFDTSNVVNMEYAFAYLINLSKLDVSGFNTSSVTSMRWMFGCDYNVEELDVSEFDTSNVKHMGDMFFRCESIESIDVSDFDTRKVTNIGWMFGVCKSIKNLDLSSFDTSQVTTMVSLFSECSNLETADISSFDTSNANISNLFYECDSLLRVKLGAATAFTDNLGLEKGEWQRTNDLECTRFDEFSSYNPDKPGWYERGYKDVVISGIKEKTWTGRAQAQDPVVKLSGKTLMNGTDYDIIYKNNINVGTASMTIKGKGSYTGSAVVDFKINKAANPLTIKAKTATSKYSKLKKKNQTLAVTKVITFTKEAKDKKTYTLVSAKKGSKSFKKYFKINKTTGKVTVKKRLKKGTYKVKVKVKAAGNANYKASAVKTVTFKVKVK